MSHHTRKMTFMDGFRKDKLFMEKVLDPYLKVLCKNYFLFDFLNV